MLETGKTFWKDGRFNTVACISEGSTCYVLGVYQKALAEKYAPVLFAIMVAGFILGGTVSASLRASAYRKSTLDAALRHAVAGETFVLNYQPIVDSRTGLFTAAEALIRWNLPSGLSMSPDVFIAAAEETNLITQISIFVLKRVESELGEFLRCHREFRISINITTKDLIDARFNAALEAYIENKGIHSHQLALELTERRSISTRDELSALKNLLDRGYHVYIDDFGTGYSNFSYLGDLSVDAIKVDRSFTASVGTNHLRKKIVGVMISLAHELGMGVIVEGIESIDQMRYFQSLDVWLMQGWLFGRALPANQLIELLSAPWGGFQSSGNDLATGSVG